MKEKQEELKLRLNEVFELIAKLKEDAMMIGNKLIDELEELGEFGQQVLDEALKRAIKKVINEEAIKLLQQIKYKKEEDNK